jgi:hypothetical protein
LDRNGLPRTSVGVDTLIEGTQELSRDEIRDLRVVQGVGSDEIDYLNKIIGTINMFPEFSETALPSASEFRGEEAAPTRIKNIDDASNLKLGEAWEFIDEDGTLHSGVMGEKI